MSAQIIDYLNIPIYPISVASHHLMLSFSTARSWVSGRSYETQGGKRHSKPLLSLADPRNKRASFTNLVELFMIQAIRQQYNVPMQEIRRAINYLKKQTDYPHPLAHSSLKTDGKYILVDQFDGLINASRGGQVEMADLIDPYVNRIRWAEDLAVGLSPFLRREQSDAVYIDPKIKGGRPCVKGTGITTTTLADRWAAGETYQEIASDFGLESYLVEEAIRFEKAS
jgi:uncharacterized protein (DUF433 family)